MEEGEALLSPLVSPCYQGFKRSTAMSSTTSSSFWQFLSSTRRSMGWMVVLWLWMGWWIASTAVVSGEPAHTLSSNNNNELFHRCRRPRNDNSFNYHPYQQSSSSSSPAGTEKSKDDASLGGDAADWSSRSLLQDLQQTSCQPCRWSDRRTASTIAVPHDSLHVVVLLTSQQTFEKSMVTAAGLLSRGMRVTMIAAPNMPPEDLIWPALSQHLPCAQLAVAHSLLTFRVYPIPDELPCPQQLDHNHNHLLMQSPSDSLWCSIVNAPPLAYSISEALTSLDEEPDVMMVDATSVAGLLVAEACLVPSLVLVETTGLLRQVLGSPTSSLSDAFHDRLNSLDSTSSFLALNRVRRTLGLARIRTLADLWKAPGNVIWTATTEPGWEDDEKFPHVLTFAGPFLPPCVPCDSAYVKTKTLPPSHASIPSVVVSAAFRNDEKGRRNVRKLLQGLSLARASIQDLSKNHSFATTADGVEIDDLRVILMGPPHDFVLPDFVQTASSAFLDVLAANGPTAALVSLCDSTNVWTRKLGAPVLCLDTNWSARQIAAGLLETIQSQGDGETPVPVEDALEQIISVIQTLAVVKSLKGHVWSNGWEIRRDVLRRLNLSPSVSSDSSLSDDLNFDWWQELSGLLFYLAWAMVAFSVIYLTLKDASFGPVSLLSRMNISRRLHHRHRRNTSHDSLKGGSHDFFGDSSHNGKHNLRPGGFNLSVWTATLTEELLRRLPELDRLWLLWLAWTKRVLAQLKEDEGSAVRDTKGVNGDAHVSMSTENGNHNNRLRKKGRSVKSKRH